MAEERDRLRTTFDEAASLYDEVRPGYPEDLFDDIVSLSGIPAGGRILEIGCGTGQATVPFARRGYRILCIELGENMAAVARRNLEGYPNAEVSTGAFEDTSSQEGAFDLAISATAFHWLDPAVAYPKTARALRVGGSLALFWSVHVHSAASEGFFEAAQRIYEREAREIWDHKYEGPPRSDEVPDRTCEIDSSGLFETVTRCIYRWDETYDTEGYLRVLNTYSGHRSLNDDTRERLFRGIADLIDNRFGGRIVKGYLTTLYVARRR
ncbi:MAG TPA: class I SAM-dependent methyltransferase [Rubrobacter sp.]|jgi:SAM-dependent methyltransferase|nr:class I SAM-dependent methyltransferase [Rubrobacter sp.]